MYYPVYIKYLEKRNIESQEVEQYLPNFQDSGCECEMSVNMQEIGAAENVQNLSCRDDCTIQQML